LFVMSGLSSTSILVIFMKITKIDVDDNPDITNKYAIQAMPTLILFKGGEIAARHTGAMVQKSKLEAWIKESA
ncbi:MAG: thioredoxin family protein, partial [Pseudomonadota bacterium]